LGSTSTLTDQSGNVTERIFYDPWGKRRNANGTDDASCSIVSASTRGFTGQEHIDSLCAINFNARIYDPVIGRFMSADSVVPNALDGQAYNRYSYVENGPLSAIDPTGHDCSSSSGGGSGYGAGGCVETIVVKGCWICFANNALAAFSASLLPPFPSPGGQFGGFFITVNGIVFSAPPQPNGQRDDTGSGQGTDGGKSGLKGDSGKHQKTRGNLHDAPLGDGGEGFLFGLLTLPIGGEGFDVEALEGAANSSLFKSATESLSKVVGPKLLAKIAEEFDTPAEAIGAVDGVATLVDSAATKDPDIVAEGFTETLYYLDSEGTQHTVFF
jgi:RHS repeat-associated protein